MNLAYVLINTDMGSEERVTSDLNKVEEVKEARAREHHQTLYSYCSPHIFCINYMRTSFFTSVN